MPINLEPRLDALQHRLTKGALVRMADGDKGNLAAEILHFQYNPETVTRTRAGKWEPRKRRKRQVESPQEVRARSGQGSSALMAESETIALKLVFDATEAILAGRADTVEKGILPQLAVLELISLGKEEKDTRSKKSKIESARPVRPDEQLLVLGDERSYPVVMTSLTITEQKFNLEMVPIRAEVDLKFNVLEPAESAYREWIKSAFDDLFAQRTANAAVAVTTTEAQTLDAISAALENPTGQTADRAAAGTEG